MTICSAVPGAAPGPRCRLVCMSTLLFDPDCGFCTRCAGWMRRLGLDAEILPMTPPALEQHGIDPRRAGEQIPFVDDDGEVHFGARAIGLALATGAGPVRLAGLGLLAPGVRWLAARVYPVVARHRHQLPGGSASCRIDHS